MNKYGFRYNLNHPAVNRWYKAFLRSLGLPDFIGTTDGQRREFESIMDALWERGKLPDNVFNRTAGNDRR